MKWVSVQEAETNFSGVLAVAEGGDSVVICRNGEPVAQLLPHQQPMRRLKFDPALAPIAINYDPIEPLQDDEWPQEHR